MESQYSDSTIHGCCFLVSTEPDYNINIVRSTTKSNGKWVTLNQLSRKDLWYKPLQSTVDTKNIKNYNTVRL